MDAKKKNSGNHEPAAAGGAVGTKQRRALARLGLSSAGAYVAPTLLSLRTAEGPSAGSGSTIVAA